MENVKKSDETVEDTDDDLVIAEPYNEAACSLESKKKERIEEEVVLCPESPPVPIAGIIKIELDGHNSIPSASKREIDELSDDDLTTEPEPKRLKCINGYDEQDYDEDSKKVENGVIHSLGKRTRQAYANENVLKLCLAPRMKRFRKQQHIKTMSIVKMMT